MSYNDEKEVAGILGCSFLVIGLFIAFCVVVGMGYWLWYYPDVQMKGYTEAAHNSYGYNTTQAQELENYKIDYQKLQTQIDQSNNQQSIQDLQSQQQSDIQMMKEKVSLMDKSQVPSDITVFLGEHS